MRPLARGEEERFEEPVRTPRGPGRVIATSFGVAVHSDRDGAILDLLYPEVEGVGGSGRGAVIRWGGGRAGSLRVSCRDGARLRERLRAAAGEFRAAAGASWAAGGPPRPPEAPPRPPAVPRYVPDELVWHDAWYDAPRELFVTLNPYFAADAGLRRRPHQIEYERQTGGAGGIVASRAGVEMRMGYPAVRVGAGGSRRWMLLPSLTPGMVTAEIAAARAAGPGPGRVDYHPAPPPGP